MSKEQSSKVEQEPVAWVNCDEIDNILEDRAVMVYGVQSGWAKTPLYDKPFNAEELQKENNELKEAAKLALKTLEQGGMLHRVQTITALKKALKD